MSNESEITQVNDEGYRNISSEKLMEIINFKDFVLVNVHIPYEGEIDGTDLLMPYNNILNNLNKLPEDKTSKIIIYCKRGINSVKISKKLVQLGYTNMINLSGGMSNWKECGFKIIKKNNQ